MKKKILISIAVLLFFLAIIPLFLPKKMKLEAEKEFNFPIQPLFDECNNLKKFTQWSEWAKKDSTIEMEFFPPYIGKGALYKWKGKSKEVGEGQMQIIESINNSSINYELEFKNWDKKSNVKIQFDSISKNKSKLSWYFEGSESPYFFRYFNLFFKTRLQKDINKSLENLEQLLVKKKNDVPKPISLSEGIVVSENFVGAKYIGIKITSTAKLKDQTDIINFAFDTISSYLKYEVKMNPTKIGKPVVFYQMNDTINNKAIFYVGVNYIDDFSIKQNKQKDNLLKVKDEQNQIKFEKFIVPSSQTAVTVHRGTIEEINQTQKLLDKYIRTRNFTPKSQILYELKESYLDSLNVSEIKIYQSYKN